MQGVNSDSDGIGLCVRALRVSHILAEFTVPPALMLMLGDRNLLLRSTAVTPEIQGSTRAPVLRRGGRTARGVAPGIDRVKSAGVMQIHRPLPFSFG